MKRNVAGNKLIMALMAGALLGSSLAQRARADDAADALSTEERLLGQIFTDSRDGRLIATVLRQSQDKELLPLFLKLMTMGEKDKQVESMVSAALLAKDSSLLKIDRLLEVSDMNMAGAALAALIEGNAISDDQLRKVVTDAPDAAQRVLAASELNHRKALPDHKVLLTLLGDSKSVVRYYAAVTLLENKDPVEVSAALAALADLRAKNDPRDEPVVGLMLMRIRKDNISAAQPWVESLAKDDKQSEGLRMTAVSVLLALDRGSGPEYLAQMIRQAKETLPQIKLGLMAFEHGEKLKPETVGPLLASDSLLVKQIAGVARQAAEGGDATGPFIKLIKEGQPIVLDWALLYADRAQTPRKIAIWDALLQQSAIVDQRREQDYERAALAAQKLLDEGGEPGRRIITAALQSDNIGVVEAALLGMMRSDQRNFSEMVLPIWTPAFYKKPSNEGAANLAALVLGREGRAEAKAYLQTMTETAENSGYRALAGWYFAKLSGQGGQLVQRVVSAVK